MNACSHNSKPDSPDLSYQSDYQSIDTSSHLDAMSIRYLFQYYRKRYLTNEWASAFVASHDNLSLEERTHPTPCLCDRTLNRVIGGQRTLEGGAIRGSLKHLGLLAPVSGVEIFRNCIVFPVFDDEGDIVSACGYRYGARVRNHSGIVKWTKPSVLGDATALRQHIEEVRHAKALF